MKDTDILEIRAVLQKFQHGYDERNLERLDSFMNLFVAKDDVELIGIGAAQRGGYEWFEGLDKVREIIQSDWEHWGNVVIDVACAKINVHGEVAWLSTTGILEQTDHFNKTLPFFLKQMKDLLEDEDKTPDEQLVEATHYGMRRLRERLKKVGHPWPFVITATLEKEAGHWRFHTIHWSMPVD